MEYKYALKATCPLGEEQYDCSATIDGKSISFLIKEERGSVNLSGLIENNSFSADGSTETPMRTTLNFSGILDKEKLVGSINIGDYCKVEVVGEVQNVSI